MCIRDSHKIDTGGIDFDVVMEDVQTLNTWSLDNRLDISKISYGVWPLLQSDYRLLDSGGALGMGVGPLLVSAKPVSIKEIDHSTVAIPGINTTAHLLFSLAFPGAAKKEFMVFSDIEDAILNGKTAAGVIIHENRFTYQQKGLLKVMDLGEYWQETTGSPIPLGGIVMKKSLPAELCEQVDILIRSSVEFAFTNYPVLPAYVKEHASEMNDEVMRMHIDLYVNKYSVSLGDEGIRAIGILLDVYRKLHGEISV